jgi:hypothetical protein
VRVSDGTRTRDRLDHNTARLFQSVAAQSEKALPNRIWTLLLGLEPVLLGARSGSFGSVRKRRLGGGAVGADVGVRGGQRGLHRADVVVGGGE